MSAVHGKNAYISVDGTDLSAFSNNIQMPREAESHDVTTFGNSAHRYVGGLKDGTCTIQGIYDNTVGGPADTLEPLLGQTVEVVYRPDGTGEGKPEKVFDAVLTSYEETVPVADMVTWSAEFQIDGDVLVGSQTTEV